MDKATHKLLESAYALVTADLTGTDYHLKFFTGINDRLNQVSQNCPKSLKQLCCVFSKGVTCCYGNPVTYRE